MKKIMMLLMVIGLFGCNDSKDKTIFSEWNGIDNEKLLDLSKGELGAVLSIQMALIAGPICNCSITYIGTDLKGSYDLGDCSAVISQNEAACQVVSGEGNYTVLNSKLEICGTSTLTPQLTCTYWE